MTTDAVSTTVRAWDEHVPDHLLAYQAERGSGAPPHSTDAPAGDHTLTALAERGAAVIGAT